MTRYRLMILLIVLAISLQIAPVSQAQQEQERPIDEMVAMAALFPPVDAFAVVANDPAYLDWLDDLTLRITSRISDDIVPATTLRNLVNQAIVPGSEADFVSIVTGMLGEHVAFGVDHLDVALTQVPVDGSPLIVYAVAPIRNRLLFEGLLTLTGLLNEAERGFVGGYSTYTLAEKRVVLAVGNRYLFAVAGSTDLPFDLATTLADDPDFEMALDALPLDDYGAVIYGTSGGLMRGQVTDLMIQEILAAVDLDIGFLGPMAAGFEVVAGHTVLVDMAQVRSSDRLPRNRPVTPAFARYIPGEAQVFIHTRDIEVLLNTAAGLIASISASDTTTDVYHQIERLVELLLGLDLETDILPWIGGDYGAFAAFDSSLEEPPAAQIGVLLEITDPEAADRFIHAVANAVGQFSEDTTVEAIELPTETGAALDAISFRVLDVLPGPLDLVLGHTESFLFVATHDAAVNLLDGGPSLADSAIYQTAQQVILPDSAVSVYVDGEAPHAAFGLLNALRPALIDQMDPSAATIAPDIIAEMVESSTISLVSSLDNSLLIRLTVQLDME